MSFDEVIIPNPEERLENLDQPKKLISNLMQYQGNKKMENLQQKSKRKITKDDIKFNKDILTSKRDQRVINLSTNRK